MPDISLEARQRSRGDEEERALVAGRQAEFEKAQAAGNFALLDELHGSAGWKWFCENVLEPAVAEVRDAALDVETKSATQRETAAWQHAFGVKLLMLLEEKRAFWAARAGLGISDR